MSQEIERTIREVRDVLLSNPVSPRVEDPEDINNHFCSCVAETVAGRVDDQLDVRILEDGAMGMAHVWIACEGRHYDAECPDGVTDYRDLPFFRRHPEAVMHVEPGSVSLATVRNRTTAPG